MVAIQLRSGLSGFESQNILCCLKQCHIEGESVNFLLQRRHGNDNEQFRRYANHWIARELSRIPVLTGKLLKAEDLRTETALGVTVRVPTAWDH